jgi:hypothetical protein
VAREFAGSLDSLAPVDAHSGSRSRKAAVPKRGCTRVQNVEVTLQARPIRTRASRRRPSAAGHTGQNGELMSCRDYAVAVGKCRKAVRKALKLIENDLCGGNTRAARNRERNLLKSYALRLVSAHRARVRLAWLERQNAKATGRHIAGRRYGPSLTETLDVARQIDLWRPTPERVGVATTAKTNGTLRELHMFGLDLRARQEMLRTVLMNRAILHPSQYATRAGLLKIQRDVLNALASGEYTVAAYVDIRECFRSISVAALGDLLKFPEAVVRANTGFDHLNIDVRQARAVREEVERKQTEYDRFNSDDVDEYIGRRHYHYQHCYQEPRGIPLGSSCSPIIAEMAIAECLRSVPSGVALFVWVDDILILAKTEEGAQRAVETLRAAFAAAPVGPFMLKPAQFAAVAEGFEFVGSTFKYAGTELSIEPTAKNLRKLEIMMRGHLHQISHYGDDRGEADAALAGWAAANQLWGKKDDVVRRYRAELSRAEAQYVQFYRGRSRIDRKQSDFLLRSINRHFAAPSPARSQHKKVRDNFIAYVSL